MTSSQSFFHSIFHPKPFCEFFSVPTKNTLTHLETLEPHLPDFVVERPADVLEIGVVEEDLVELLHPDPDLGHADGADLGQRVPAAMEAKAW